MLRRGARELARAIAGVVDAHAGAVSRAGDALQRLHVARGPRSSSASSAARLLSSSSDASPRTDVWRAWMGYGEGERGRRDDGTHPAGALARGHRRVRRRGHAPRSTWDPERVHNDLIIKHSRRTESLLALIGGTHEDAWEIVTFENDDGDDAKDDRDAMPVKREWRPVNVATAANRLVNVSLRTSRHRDDRLGAALRVLRDERYVLLVRMIASTVDEFGPVETATTLKALASMQMYADNARATSPHQTLSRTSRRRRRKEETTEETTEETNAADVDLAEGLARAVSRNAHRMHARLLALTLPALRLLPGVTKLIDAETYSTLAGAARAAARSGALGAVETANVAYAMTRIPPLLRVANEPTNHAREGGEEEEEGAGEFASCAAEIAARGGDGRGHGPTVRGALVGFDHPAAAAGRRRGGRRAARSPARDAARGARGRGRARGARGDPDGEAWIQDGVGADARGVETAGGRAAGAVGDVAGGGRATGWTGDDGRRGRGRAGEGGRRRRVSATRAAAGGGARGDWPTFITLIFYLRTF